MPKLTKTQKELLKEVAKGVLYLPRSYPAGQKLEALGLVAPRAEASRIFAITEAGRAALATQPD